MTNVKIQCETCKKEFLVPLKRYNWKRKLGEGFFCCKECAQHRNSIKMTCATCGKELWISKTRLKRSKSGKVYCSKHCATIENNHLKVGIKHPNYTGGTSSYRQLAFRKYPLECAVCHWNEDSDVLQVHHIDENRKNNELDNLIILCPTCHFKLTIGKYQLTKDRKKIISK